MKNFNEYKDQLLELFISKDETNWNLAWEIGVNNLSIRDLMELIYLSVCELESLAKNHIIGLNKNKLESMIYMATLKTRERNRFFRNKIAELFQCDGNTIAIYNEEILEKINNKKYGLIRNILYIFNDNLITLP